MKPSRDRFRRRFEGRAVLVAAIAMLGVGMVSPTPADAQQKVKARSGKVQRQGVEPRARNQPKRAPRARVSAPATRRPVRREVTARPRPASRVEVARVRRGPMVRKSETIPTRPGGTRARGDDTRRRGDASPDRARTGQRDRDRYDRDRYDRDRDRYDRNRYDRDRDRYDRNRYDRDRDRYDRNRYRGSHRSGRARRGGFRIGVSFGTLPRGHRHYRWRGHDYWYHSGSYYRRHGRTYRVVVAPIGFFIGSLPYGYDVIRVRGRRVYYYDGVFYEYDRWRGGYVVIPAPYGVEVAYLPDDFAEIWRGGHRYYYGRGVHYRPVRRSGVTFYLSVRL